MAVRAEWEDCEAVELPRHLRQASEYLHPERVMPPCCKKRNHTESDQMLCECAIFCYSSVLIASSSLHGKGGPVLLSRGRFSRLHKAGQSVHRCDWGVQEGRSDRHVPYSISLQPTQRKSTALSLLHCQGENSVGFYFPWHCIQALRMKQASD